MRRKLSLLLAGVLLAASLAGCGASPSESTAASAPTAGSSEEGLSGSFTMWVWTDISSEIEAYQKLNPNVEIEQVVIDAGDYLTKLQTTVASGGQLPDLIWGEISNRGQIFEMDILDDLSGEPYNFDPSSVEECVLPTMKNEEGTILGVERNLVPSGLAYHRGLAEQYLGTSDPDEVTAMFPDWDTFIEAGKQVVADNNGEVMMFSSLGDVYYIVNGQMDQARISDGVIHKDAVLQLFEEICKFRDAGIVGKLDQWSPAWYASFGTEDAMFSPMPSYGEANWLIPNAPDGEGDWALIVPPGGGFSWGGTCWGITKDSQNKELAWDFVEFDMFGEGADIRQQEGGELPSAAGYMDDKVDEENEYFGGQKTGEVFINEILPTINSHVPTPYDYADICTIEVVLSSLNTDYSMTAQDAVDAYVAEMQNQAPDLAVE